MKPILITTLLALAVANVAIAQPNPTPASPAKASPATSATGKPTGQPLPSLAQKTAPWEVGVETDGTLRLNRGHLMDVVQAIERNIPLMQKHATDKQTAAKWIMPNLVWNDVGEAQVPTHLVMRQVTPLQAITLAVEAAGCQMQPIYAPEEASDDAADPLAGTAGAGRRLPIIGYRIEQRQKQTSFSAEDSSRRSVPPSSSSLGSRSESAKQTSTTPKLPPTTAGNSARSSTVISAPAPAVPSGALFTRVYALGTWLGPKPANDPETLAKEKKLHGLQELIWMAIDRAGLAEQGKGLDMVFHDETAAVIIRTTEAKHAIIEQTIEALIRPVSK